MVLNETPIVKEITMSIKREIIAFAIRILASETDLIRKPEPFEELLCGLFGQEPYDQRMARNVVVKLDAATDLVKRVNLDRKFKKITKNF